MPDQWIGTTARCSIPEPRSLVTGQSKFRKCSDMRLDEESCGQSGKFYVQQKIKPFKKTSNTVPRHKINSRLLALVEPTKFGNKGVTFKPCSK